MIRKIMIGLGVAISAVGIVIALVFAIRTVNSNKEILLRTEKLIASISAKSQQAGELTQAGQPVSNPDDPDAQAAAEPIETIDVDGITYIGMIEIPAIDVYIPVAADCTESNLNGCPCLYVGEDFSKMIIAGHNFANHFGKLKNLSPGDKVIITDVNGSFHNYLVQQIELINGNDVEGMLDGDYNLSLFTCDNTRLNRCTVRCVKE